MIKFTISKGTERSERFFNKEIVIIGSHNSPTADLSLENEVLQEIHVKIQGNQGHFLIINEANDPFVNLNELPFGKKKLKNQDRIQIGSTEIYFEYIASSTKPAVPAEVPQPMPPPPEQEKEVAKSTTRDDLHTLMEQVEHLDAAPWPQPVVETIASDHLNKLEAPEISPSPSPLTEPIETLQTKEPKLSIKDAYLSELEDDRGHWPSSKKEETSSEPVHPSWNWKLIGFSFLGLLFFLSLAGYAFYHRIQEKNNLEVIKVASHVADVAMSLTYAHIKQTKPQNQTWSDPEFLRHQLMAVLGNEYNPSLNMDLHGQFNDSSYLLRIYTSSDLSRFLVIVQPEPSLWHWIFPRSSIIVDSQAMELREMSDLKSVNRLLLNPSLDSLNASEVTQIVKQGKLIPLSLLASNLSNQGFTPPKVLNFIRPGSENLIYNAPRYYRFGEVFMKKALLLTENHSSSQEVEALQQEVKGLSSHPNIVLYSSQGMQWAVQAKKALNVLIPENTLMVAYLKINSRGTVMNSHMVMDEERPEMIATTLSETNPIFIPPASSESKKMELSASPAEALSSPSVDQVEKHHPLFLQLSSLQRDYLQTQQTFGNDLKALFDSASRENAIIALMRLEENLKNQEEELTLNDQASNKSLIPFLSKLRSLIEQHETHEVEFEEKVIKSISKLYHEYSEMSAAQFLAYVQAAGLGSFVDDRLKLQEQKVKLDSHTDHQIREEILHIKDAHNLAKLGEHVETLARLLNLEQFSDPKKLISYQAEIRSHILDKLNDFLLSSSNPLPTHDFNEENRPLLIQILKSSWITDPDEYEFYINEFDVRMKEQ